MGTLWTGRGVRVFFAMAVTVVVVTLSGCGSSSSTTSTTTSLSTSTTGAPATAPSIPSSPSTIPPTFQGACSALNSALVMSELQPRDAGNWPAERQRIITDTAANVALFSRARPEVPVDIAKALGTLEEYSLWLGETVADSSTFDAATNAVKTYPDLAGVSVATSVVETWKRTNC